MIMETSTLKSRRSSRSTLKKTDSVKDYTLDAIEDQLEKETNPRTREILMLAQIETLKEKSEKRDKVINQMKELMEHDENIKLALQEKINELRKKLEKVKQDIQKIDDPIENENIIEMDDNIDFNISNNKPENDKSLIVLAKVQDRTIFNNFFKNPNRQDYNTDINPFQENIEESCLGSIKEGLNDFIEYLLPLKKDISYISSHYDKNVEGFFEFLRYLYFFSLLIMLGYLYLIISHLIYFDYSNNDKFCYYYIPCVVYYSRFGTNEKLAYSYTFSVSCLIIFFVTLKKYLSFIKKDVMQKLYESEEYNYSKYFFNIWDWNVRNPTGTDEFRFKVKNIVTIGILEHEVNIKIKERTRNQKIVLFLRRSFSIFISIIILAISAGLIAGSYYLMGLVITNTKNSSSFIYTSLSTSASFIPPIIIALVNALIPKILLKFVQFEKWDFNSTEVSQMVWRLFIARLFNIIVVYFLNIMLIIYNQQKNFLTNLNLGFSFNTCPGSITSSTSYNACPEDQMAINLFTNFLVDFIIRKVIEITTYLISKCRATKPSEHKKYSYDVADAAPDSMIFVIQMFVLIPIFPFVTIIGPILLYFEFKFEFFKIKNLRSKPGKLSLKDDTGYFIMSLFSFAMYLILGLFVLLLDFGVPHSNWLNCSQTVTTNKLCGPFENYEIPSNIIVSNFNSIEIVYYFYTVISSPVFIFVSLIVLVVFIFFSDDSDSFLKFIKEKEKEYKNSLNGISQILKKSNEKLRYIQLEKLRDV